MSDVEEYDKYFHLESFNKNYPLLGSKNHRAVGRILLMYLHSGFILKDGDNDFYELEFSPIGLPVNVFQIPVVTVRCHLKMRFINYT